MSNSNINDKEPKHSEKPHKGRHIFTDTDTEELFLSIMNTARDPLVILDDGLRVKIGNVSFYRNFHVSPAETDGRIIFDIGNGQWNIPKLRSLLEQILPGKTTFDDFEVDHEFKDIGRKVMLLNARQVIGPPPVREKLILLAIEDITLRKDLAQQRDQALKAQEELIAVVPHELKNPLATITSSLDLAKRVLWSDNGQEKVQKLLDNIYAAARRMIRIVSDLLDVSKIESGRFPLELATVEAISLIEEVITLSLPPVLDKSIRIEKHIAKEVGDIICDRGRIVQALLNLLNNAIKFSGDGGVIRVEVDRVSDQIRFQIKDTGCGISVDQLPHVFERFWQAKHQQYVGSGLGLYITKSIVETHGGKVGVESRDGEGSTFYFTLPASNEVGEAQLKKTA